MPLPKLENSAVTWVVQQVSAYIGQQRQLFRSQAAPLNLQQRTAMQSFFPPSVLDTTRVVVLHNARVANPPFYQQLVEMGFAADDLPDFSFMAAITFIDTVVAHEPFTGRLLFHELVHAVQYQKLGLEDFASRYVRGFLNGGSYEAIPLEINAYELDGRFTAAPSSPFSVDTAVQSWITTQRF